jgi:hypothetical protein
MRRFLEAIAAAYPENAPRDRYGRIMQANTNPLRDLAVEYKVGGCQDVADQAGKVARAILREIKAGQRGLRRLKEQGHNARKAEE